FYQRSPVGEKFCLIIGNEGNGISDEVKATATHRVKLPMRGGAESLNAAIAAGIMMYDLMKDV
ncbi:MAG: RNA methyltransferase, partial [Clostridia bacterium]|nr:RNA methyltransferase [Clostridia bacterium]